MKEQNNERNNIPPVPLVVVVNNRALRDYALVVAHQNFSGIQRPTMQANNFKTKSVFI